LQTSQKLNEPHTPEADYTSYRHLSIAPERDPQLPLLALLPFLATRKKLAKVAVAVLAENSSLKKIQAITSGSSLEAGGREVGVTAHGVSATTGDSIVLERRFAA